MQCKKCGAEVGSEYRLCPYCRTELEYPTSNQQAQQPTIIVQNVINNDNNVYGGRTVVAHPSRSSKSKMVTLILAIFLGYLGIHRFYAGKVGSGILYFLTAGLFFFGWIYDIIKIASGTFRDANNLPITK